MYAQADREKNVRHLESMALIALNTHAYPSLSLHLSANFSWSLQTCQHFVVKQEWEESEKEPQWKLYRCTFLSVFIITSFALLTYASAPRFQASLNTYSDILYYNKWVNTRPHRLTHTYLCVTIRFDSERKTIIRIQEIKYITQMPQNFS